MNTRPYILSVDDESLNQDMIETYLNKNYEIKTLSNGQECLDDIEYKIPDLILLDVNMPVLNGLDTCKKLRESEKYKDVIIMFVSANDSPEERLQGYKSGGDDYITKPIVKAELLSKIDLLLKLKKDISKAKEEAKYATDTAMGAMISASETGVVLQFMRSSLNVNSLDDLHKLVFESLTSYSLQGCVMFNYDTNPVFRFSDEIDRPIEKDVLIGAHRKGKIIEFSGRAIFNSEHAAILIRRMPEDKEKTGRLKDHLALLIDVIEEQIVKYVNDKKKLNYYFTLENTIESVTKQLQQVILSYQKQRLLNASILGDLLQDIEAAFLKLGLTELQEELLINLITNAEKETEKTYENEQVTSDTFDEIVRELMKLLDHK